MGYVQELYDVTIKCDFPFCTSSIGYNSKGSLDIALGNRRWKKIIVPGNSNDYFCPTHVNWLEKYIPVLSKTYDSIVTLGGN